MVISFLFFFILLLHFFLILILAIFLLPFLRGKKALSQRKKTKTKREGKEWRKEGREGGWKEGKDKGNRSCWPFRQRSNINLNLPQATIALRADDKLILKCSKFVKLAILSPALFHKYMQSFILQSFKEINKLACEKPKLISFVPDRFT